MLTAKDIQFHTLDRENASLLFEVKDLKAVQEFMNNKNLQEFLTADYDSDGAKRGCRLILTLNTDLNENGKPTLVIRRKMGAQTVPAFAGRDLVHSLVTFIFPPTWYNYNDLADITVGLGQQEVHDAYATGVQKVKGWSRAEAFLLPSKLHVKDDGMENAVKKDEAQANVAESDETAKEGIKSKMKV